MYKVISGKFNNKKAVMSFYSVTALLDFSFLSVKIVRKNNA